MKCKIALIGLALVLVAAGSLFGSDRNRTGSFYVAPRGAITYPSGALADGNYNQPASSWRKEGWTFATELGYYFSGTTCGGFDLAYSNFPPKALGSALDSELDDSRVAVWRAALFLKYFMVPRGSVRPFIKLAAGYYELRRYAMPLPESDPLEYQNYSLTAEPVFAAGLGFAWDFSGFLSAEISVEGIRLNSFHSDWSTAGGSVGPLKHNLMFFPFHAGLTFHLGGR
jgi:hypothetical protein